MKQLVFNIVLAFRAIRSNRLRFFLTIAIIALGIMALVGILTAIEVMKSAVYSNFSNMGANSFQVTSDVIKRKSRKGGVHVSVTEGKNITYNEAREFRDRLTFPATVGISFSGTNIATVKFRSTKTNPNVRVTGVDELYMTVTDSKLLSGRNFTTSEVQSGSFVCILGSGAAKKLFSRNPASAVNEIVSVGDVKCRVIAVMEKKGGSMIMDADNAVLLPLNTARGLYGGDNTFLISVKVSNLMQKEVAAEEAEGLFRGIRKLPLGTENDFTITQNNELVNIVLDSIKYIRWAAVIIGIITLLGSVIGLMNIMLVSVAERTREIGINKALGAKSSTIKRQFLTEAIFISLAGGSVGILLGIILGNSLSLAFGTGFVMPWLWILFGFSLCTFVGIISGIFPAIKASKLDPIVALRYE